NQSVRIRRPEETVDVYTNKKTGTVAAEKGARFAAISTLRFADVMVNVASDEAVVAGTKVWRRLGKTISIANVLKPDYAINELSRRLPLQKIDRPVRVLNAEFCYFERGENDETN